jgi:hypothetical protein
VDIVHPGLAVDKQCEPAEVYVNESFTVTITITNTGDWPLEKQSIADTFKGDLAASCGTILDAGDTCTITYVVPVNAVPDPNPMVNTVTAAYKVQDLPNILTGSASCSVNVKPPDQGCTPGFWKNHEELWDGGTDDVTKTIKTYLGFNSVFQVSSAQSGLDNSVTLSQALEVSGSDLMALNRHAAAALANADSGINFGFTVGAVIALYQDAVGAIPGPLDVGSALAILSTANQRLCPLGSI